MRHNARRTNRNAKVPLPLFYTQKRNTANAASEIRGKGRQQSAPLDGEIPRRVSYNIGKGKAERKRELRT